MLLTTIVFQKSISTNLRSGLLFENVEVLAKTESIGNSTIKGDCFSSVVVIVECSVYCNNCKTVWYPSPRAPKLLKMSLELVNVEIFRSYNKLQGLNIQSLKINCNI